SDRPAGDLMSPVHGIDAKNGWGLSPAARAGCGSWGSAGPLWRRERRRSEPSRSLTVDTPDDAPGAPLGWTHDYPRHHRSRVRAGPDRERDRARGLLGRMVRTVQALRPRLRP